MFHLSVEITVLVVRRNHTESRATRTEKIECFISRGKIVFSISLRPFFGCALCLQPSMPGQMPNTKENVDLGSLGIYGEKVKKKQPIIALAAAPFRMSNMLFSIWDLWFLPSSKSNYFTQLWFLVDHKNWISFRSFEMFSHNNRATELKIIEHRFVRTSSKFPGLFICQ